MPITNLSRDWGDNPSIVRVVTTDSLATVITPGYITTQATNIAAIQHGVFEWRATDFVLIAGVDATTGALVYEAFFNVSPTFTSFVIADNSGMVTQTLLTSALIDTMYTTPVQVLPPLPVSYKYIIRSITGDYSFGTVQYTGGGAIGLEWGNPGAAHLAGPAASTTLAAATFNGYAASNTFELTPDNTDTLANIAGMGVYASNATAVFATGDGSLVYTVTYQIVPI